MPEKKVKQYVTLKKRLLYLVVILIIILISYGLFYLYKNHPDQVTDLKTYGYLGAFSISLIFNASVILPLGNIVILTALAATLPSATLVGLAGGSGAALGEITGYIAGYSGRGLIGKGKMYGRVEKYIKRWGSLTIFVLSVVPFVFDLAGIAAGAIKFPFWKFLLLCWVGRTIFYVGFLLLASLGLRVVIPWLAAASPLF